MKLTENRKMWPRQKKKKEKKSVSNESVSNEYLNFNMNFVP